MLAMKLANEKMIEEQRKLARVHSAKRVKSGSRLAKMSCHCAYVRYDVLKCSSPPQKPFCAVSTTACLDMPHVTMPLFSHTHTYTHTKGVRTLITIIPLVQRLECCGHHRHFKSAHSSYITLIGEHEMHSRVHPNNVMQLIHW